MEVFSLHSQYFKTPWLKYEVFATDFITVPKVTALTYIMFLLSLVLLRINSFLLNVASGIHFLVLVLFNNSQSENKPYSTEVFVNLQPGV